MQSYNSFSNQETSFIYSFILFLVSIYMNQKSGENTRHFDWSDIPGNTLELALGPLWLNWNDVKRIMKIYQDCLIIIWVNFIIKKNIDHCVSPFLHIDKIFNNQPQKHNLRTSWNLLHWKWCIKEKGCFTYRKHHGAGTFAYIILLNPTLVSRGKIINCIFYNRDSLYHVLSTYYIF